MGRRTSPGAARQPRFPGAEGARPVAARGEVPRIELGRSKAERRGPGERRGRFGRDRRAKRGPDLPLLVEAVFFYLYDVGRSIDLTKVADLVPAHPDLGIAKRRDTPASLTLPTPLILQLGIPELSKSEGFERLSSQAKIYEEGVVTIVVRVKTRLPMSELHGLEGKAVISQGQSSSIADFAEEGFSDALRGPDLGGLRAPVDRRDGHRVLPGLLPARVRRRIRPISSSATAITAPRC